MISSDEQVVSQTDIDTARRLAEKRYEHYSTDDIAHLRRKCQVDGMFLGAGVLDYTRLSPNLHGHLFRWLKAHKNDRFKMVLKPRSHYKSTVSHVDSIQTVLPPIEGEIYPYNLGPEARIMIGHEVLEKSAQFIHELTSHFTSNHRLMGLFPELVPNARKQRINKYQLELPRQSHWSEPTFEAFGVGGKSQGRHYDILKLDDIYGESARDSAAERATTIQWFKGIQAFFTRLKYSHLWMIGTRYDLDDVYSVAMEDYGSLMQYYIRKVVEDGVYIFPEEFDNDAVQILKKDIKTWNAWYLNDPYEGTKRFEQDWLAFYNKIEGRDALAIMTGESRELIEYENLDRVIIFDPAVTGTFGVVVTGTDSQRVYELESFRGSLKVPDQINMLFNLVLRYKPRVVAIESVLFSALYQDILRLEMRERRINFNIVPVKPRKPGTGRLNKTERIEILSPYFSSKKIWFNPDHKDIIQEYKDYGTTTDIHVLDALAYGPELWRFHDIRRYERYKKIETDMLKNRDADTGYSRIYAEG
jgi:hypothetical protein